MNSRNSLSKKTTKRQKFRHKRVLKKLKPSHSSSGLNNPSNNPRKISLKTIEANDNSSIQQAKSKQIIETINCQKCSKNLKDYEIYRPSSCEHNFCFDCLQISKGNSSYICPVCKLEIYWFYQLATGYRHFLGEFDPLRASLVETVNHSKELMDEFQNNIIKNFNDIRNHNTEMLTKLYIALKSLQSSVIWEDLQLFKININEEDALVMVDLYSALTDISRCQFDDMSGSEKPNIIDDITDNIPFVVWLRRHLLKLQKFIDPCVFNEDSFKQINYFICQGDSN